MKKVSHMWRRGRERPAGGRNLASSIALLGGGSCRCASGIAVVFVLVISDKGQQLFSEIQVRARLNTGDSLHFIYLYQQLKACVRHMWWACMFWAHVQHLSIARLSWTPFGGGSALSVAVHGSGVWGGRSLCLCDGRFGSSLVIG